MEYRALIERPDLGKSAEKALLYNRPVKQYAACYNESSKELDMIKKIVSAVALSVLMMTGVSAQTDEQSVLNQAMGIINMSMNEIQKSFGNKENTTADVPSEDKKKDEAEDISNRNRYTVYTPDVYYYIDEAKADKIVRAKTPFDKYEVMKPDMLASTFYDLSDRDKTTLDELLNGFFVCATNMNSIIIASDNLVVEMKEIITDSSGKIKTLEETNKQLSSQVESLARSNKYYVEENRKLTANAMRVEIYDKPNLGPLWWVIGVATGVGGTILYQYLKATYWN